MPTGEHLLVYLIPRVQSVVHLLNQSLSPVELADQSGKQLTAINGLMDR